jgi:hypothetical protein
MIADVDVSSSAHSFTTLSCGGSDAHPRPATATFTPRLTLR